MSGNSLRRLAARVDQWHWLILALAAPFLLFPGADARLAALAVVAALWLSAWLARREPFPVTPFNRPLLLFELMLLVSLFATFSLEASLGKLAGVILGLAVLGAFACYARSARSISTPRRRDAPWMNAKCGPTACGQNKHGFFGRVDGRRWSARAERFLPLALAAPIAGGPIGSDLHPSVPRPPATGLRRPLHHLPHWQPPSQRTEVHRASEPGGDLSGAVCIVGGMMV